MAKRGSGSQSRNRYHDPIQFIKESDMAKLEGTPKQIAWAKDIRNKWIKDDYEHLRRLQGDLQQRAKTAEMHIKNGEDVEKNREILGYVKSWSKRNEIENQAKKEMLSYITSAKEIIELRGWFWEVSLDVIDVIKKKGSKKEIHDAIDGWLTGY